MALKKPFMSDTEEDSVLHIHCLGLSGYRALRLCAINARFGLDNFHIGGWSFCTNRFEVLKSLILDVFQFGMVS